MTKAVESSLDEAKKHGWNGRFDRAIMYGAHACLSCLWCVPPGKTNRHSLHHLRRTGPARDGRRYSVGASSPNRAGAGHAWADSPTSSKLPPSWPTAAKTVGSRQLNAARGRVPAGPTFMYSAR